MEMRSHRDVQEFGVLVEGQREALRGVSAGN